MVRTFKLMEMDFVQMVDIYHKIENEINNLSNRIIMEKEQRGLSYKDLLDKLEKLDKNKYGGYCEADIRKKLIAKRPDMDFISALSHALEIDSVGYIKNQLEEIHLRKSAPTDTKLISYISRLSKTYTEEDIREKLASGNLDYEWIEHICSSLEEERSREKLLEAISTYRYFLNKGKLDRGRISQKQKDLKKEQYEKIHDELNTYETCSLEETIYGVLADGEKYEYEGIECDWQTYSEFMEEDMEKEMIKKILVINRHFPDQVEAFIDMFDFDDESNAMLEKIDLEIKN